MLNQLQETKSQRPKRVGKQGTSHLACPDYEFSPSTSGRKREGGKKTEDKDKEKCQIRSPAQWSTSLIPVFKGRRQTDL